MAPSTNGRIAVKPVDGKHFMKGVANARKMGGTFDGVSKVWMVPANRPELGAIGAYSLTWAGTGCKGCGSHTCFDGECGTGVEYR